LRIGLAMAQVAAPPASFGADMARVREALAAVRGG
jgi:hypothetical protein